VYSDRLRCGLPRHPAQDLASTEPSSSSGSGLRYRVRRSTAFRAVAQSQKWRLVNIDARECEVGQATGVRNRNERSDPGAALPHRAAEHFAAAIPPRLGVIFEGAMKELEIKSESNLIIFALVERGARKAPWLERGAGPAFASTPGAPRDALSSGRKPPSDLWRASPGKTASC
jgi:hypothetical protein